MPASRTEELDDRLSSRSKIGSGAGGVPAGTLTITSNTLPAAMNTSVWTRGAPATAVVPFIPGILGIGWPSSAINVNPPTVADAPAPLNPVVNDPTIDGTCMRRPAFTMRTSTVPEIPDVTGVVIPPTSVVPAVALKSEANGLVLLN